MVGGRGGQRRPADVRNGVMVVGCWLLARRFACGACVAPLRRRAFSDEWAALFGSRSAMMGRRSLSNASSGMVVVASPLVDGTLRFRRKWPRTRALGTGGVPVFFLTRHRQLRRFLLFVGREPSGSAKAGLAQQLQRLGSGNACRPASRRGWSRRGAYRFRPCGR